MNIGSIVLAGMVVLLILVMWVPVYIAFRRREAKSPIRRCAPVFVTQLIIGPTLVFVADAVGLLNPAGYILAITFLLAGAGFLYAKNVPLNS